jgi:hypothetical protein
MQISHKTRQKPGHFCGMPHSAPLAPFRTMPRADALVPHNAALLPQLLWQIPH